MTLITIEGETLRASAWFRRLKVGESILLVLGSSRSAPRAFRRLEFGPRPLLVEHGTQELALRRALDVPAWERSSSASRSAGASGVSCCSW